MRPLFALTPLLVAVALVAGRPAIADDAPKDTPQVAAVRQLAKLAAAGDWAAMYHDLCHPHLKGQLDAAEFARYMAGDKGKAIVALFDRVLALVDAKAGPDELIAQPQTEVGEYEFILVKLRDLPRAERAGRQWHLELALDGDAWKLTDTD